MTDCLVFNTDADAQTAMDQLNAPGAMGYANPATQTATWDVILHRATDGKPFFRKPEDRYLHHILDKLDGTKPYTIEKAQSNWFPPPPEISQPNPSKPNVA